MNLPDLLPVMLLCATRIFPWIRILHFFLPGLMCCLAQAAPIGAGKSQFTIPLDGKPLDVFAYRPAGSGRGALLIVMHGLNRNADGYREYAVSLADKLGMLVVAPLFDKERFPTDAYQRGNVVEKGVPQPKEEWTYNYIPKLVAEMRRREGRADMPYFLIGHSAGGQFLTRFAAFLPGDAARIVAANPGSHQIGRAHV